MRRAVTLSYAALAYLAFLTAFAALADFLLGVGLVRSIDDGPVVPWPSAVAFDLALSAAFGISHSVMARPAFKALWTRLVPKVVERSTYVLVASLVLGLIVWQWRALPGLIWEVEPPTARAALYALFALGAALVVVSTFLTDHFDLFGLRQAWLFAQGRPYEPVPFVERSLYRLVRHPMMVGLFVLLWPFGRA